TPRLLRRGFEIFVVTSVVGYLGVLLYGDNFPQFIASIGRIHWGWVLAGLVLASMDWFGGGLRLWLVTRQVHPRPPLSGMFLAGGMSAWGSYLTPFQSGAAPMMVYTMRRYGVPVPVAMTSTLMTFVATVIFFAIAGPLAIVLGAGKSLGGVGNILRLSLYDLFLGSLGIFAGLGVLMVVVMVFPGLVRDLIHKLTRWAGARHQGIARRLGKLEAGIEEAHTSILRFNTLPGWVSLFWAVIVSAPSHANKLLAGYVALRAVGIEAHFVDVLLLQTLITFLLYFAPTPGASGIAEVLSAAVMSVYVPRELVPLYTLLWRLTLSYWTIGFGAYVFSTWVRSGLKGMEEAGVGDDEGVPA
ncbi:MAG TPA: lysylphosphatidylglycerol synthase transmembrane domain-containing protein, partial [Gemmatimonadales bacterium]|nr:lysylphosphatidylglycerol synthase transmembrane domain-containing protein [Gemmatimonadales bacterium]